MELVLTASRAYPAPARPTTCPAQPRCRDPAGIV